jgi:mannose-6-phosphate isomerase
MDQLTNPGAAALSEQADLARSWLLDVAAPLWAARGRTPTGLFAERMTLTGEPDDSYFRTFVQARHIFSFVAIGQMGWNGPWRDLVAETMERLVQSAKRDDGFFVHRLDRDARHLDARADLYDQAFVLLALATAGGALGRANWFDEAERLLDRIEGQWSHAEGGFTEGEIVDPRVRRQNPHMHLFEAFLALHEASGRPRFKKAAADIANLARNRFIDQHSGALLEYFTSSLSPAPGIEGRIAEPGHCFEWAWLFERLAAQGHPGAEQASDDLVGFARAHGLCAVRGVAINEVLTDGMVHDAKARLWPQTERLKAAVARLRRLGDPAEALEAAAAAAGLKQYLDVAVPGLWRDKLRPDGSWIEELAPGSSLYHISCAYLELASVARPAVAAPPVGRV